MGNDTRRAAAGSGIGFVILFVIGWLLVSELFGGFADPDSFFLDYYADDSHHGRNLAGAHILLAASLSLLLFLQLLARSLDLPDVDAGKLQMAVSSGLISVALLLVGTAATVTVTMAKVFGQLTDDEPLTSSSVSLLPQFGYVLIFFAAMWTIALTIGLITWSVWGALLWSRTGRLVSVIAVVLLLTSWLTFVTILVLPAWVLGVSVWLWRSSRAAAHPFPGTPGTV